MRESPDGVSTAPTRQCAGRITAGGAGVPGAWNGPAGTSDAVAIVVCGSASARRLSHDAADAASAVSRQALAKDRITIVFVADIIVSFDQLREPRRFCHIALESSAQALWAVFPLLDRFVAGMPIEVAFGSSSMAISLTTLAVGLILKRGDRL
jgi:hypothetical protein